MTRLKRGLEGAMLTVLAGGMVAVLVLIFWVVPNEATMGLAQRIFYVHVSAAVTAFLAFFVVFAASVAYLGCGRAVWDRVARAAAELGVLFSAMVLATGPIWARPVWGAYWRWEPRLTTMLILFCAYVAYLIMRGHGGDSEAGPRLGAVMGVAAFLNVPLVYYSVRLWAPNQQLHPVHVELEPWMRLTLGLTLAVFGLLFALLLVRAVRLQRLSEEVETLLDELGRREADRGRR